MSLWVAACGLAVWVCHHAVVEIGFAQGMSDKPEPGTADGATDAPRLREGATLNGEVGSFQRQGNRIRFESADGNMQLVVLENLALERVGQLATDRLGSYQWTVSGEVTEYQGKNYLLIRRASTKKREDDSSSASDAF